MLATARRSCCRVLADSELPHTCTLDDSLSWMASPYLFPCTIEYSLIAAAVLFKMCANIGLDVSTHSPLLAEQDSDADSVDCHKVQYGSIRNVSVRLSVRLSVTEVHWRVIANLGFKFQSNFTAHCRSGEG